MYGEQEAVFSLGGADVMPYGLCMAGGALLALLVTMIAARAVHAKREQALSAVLVGIPSALLGGHLVYCMAMFPVLQADYGGFSLIWQFNRGGYTLFGAVFGVLLGLFLFRKKIGLGFAQLLDLCAPGAMAAICAGRAGEVFIGQGLGSFVESEFWQRFPFAVCTYMEEDWSEWYICVFFFEALTALVLCFCALRMLKKNKAEGHTGVTVLVLLCITQVFLEQLRMDDCIRFGFVRFTQLAALAVLLWIVGDGMIRMRRQQGKVPLLPFAEIVLTVLVVIFIEFGLEKPQFLPWLQISAFLMGTGALLCTLRAKRWVPGGIAVCAASLAFAAVLFLSLEMENLLLYMFMVLDLAVLTVCVLWYAGKSRSKQLGQNAG